MPLQMHRLNRIENEKINMNNKKGKAIPVTGRGGS
jgi:hypothetical protein